MRLTTWMLPLLAAGTLALTGAGCGKKTTEADTEQPAPAADTATVAAPEADTTPEPEADTATAPEPDTATAAVPEPAEPVAPENSIAFDVDHHDPAKEMVHGSFSGVEVTQANIDLTKPEAAMAVVEIDLSTLDTGNEKRNNHVKSGDFFDIEKFAKATLTVNGVKAAADADTYDATATLNLHGIEKAFPVSFKVVETKEDGSIVIEGEYKGLARADFGVGGAPEATNVAPTINSVKVRLHLANKP
ncbi:MAG: hypothetical protein CVU56_03900 [Deltaproteobacteria bacterium HGW-Deltaproteobacteria-14]|jgi:polyisoprenoid-binding protein YceI|nr:MAG: hypothetical protein CVU56_03900 [Deltaproteobacteria bacterium HGW-Deltaproteobacteria-14]